jgi:hypothetical protein
MEFQCIVWNKFIDEQQPFVPRNAIADQRHKMPVMHPADNLNLCLELALSLTTPIPQLLDSNFFPFGSTPL